jgi:hypothetical protein
MLSQVFDTIYTEFSVNKNFNLKNSREVAIEHFSKNRILKEIRDLFQE